MYIIFTTANTAYPLFPLPVLRFLRLTLIVVSFSKLVFELNFCRNMNSTLTKIFSYDKMQLMQEGVISQLVN